MWFKFYENDIFFLENWRIIAILLLLTECKGISYRKYKIHLMQSRVT
jgi:hypothetical protein